MRPSKFSPLLFLRKSMAGLFKERRLSTLRIVATSLMFSICPFQKAFSANIPSSACQQLGGPKQCLEPYLIPYYYNIEQSYGPGGGGVPQSAIQPPAYDGDLYDQFPPNAAPQSFSESATINDQLDRINGLCDGLPNDLQIVNGGTWGGPYLGANPTPPDHNDGDNGPSSPLAKGADYPPPFSYHGVEYVSAKTVVVKFCHSTLNNSWRWQDFDVTRTRWLKCPYGYSGTSPQIAGQRSYCAPTPCNDRYSIVFVTSIAGGTQVEPNDTLKPLYVRLERCDNGPVPAYIQVKLTVNVEDRSGFHEHPTALDNSRPKGQLSSPGVCTPNQDESIVECVTDSSGAFRFDFKAPEAAGIHKISAVCMNKYCEPVAPLTLNVKVPGLIPDSTASNGFFQYVGDTNEHPQNNFMRSDALGQLVLLSNRYNRKFGDLLYLNDASLPWGGVFDYLNFDWKGPHAEHRCGRAVDVRGNGNQNLGAIPLSRDDVFKSFAALAQVGVHPENKNDPVRGHYHLQLLGKDARERKGKPPCNQLP